jgi:hypothetical protein
MLQPRVEQMINTNTFEKIGLRIVRCVSQISVLAAMRVAAQTAKTPILKRRKTGSIWELPNRLRIPSAYRQICRSVE